MVVFVLHFSLPDYLSGHGPELETKRVLGPSNLAVQDRTMDLADMGSRAPEPVTKKSARVWMDP
jgi:hypothetical protein